MNIITKILIAVPCMETLHVGFVRSLVKIIRPENTEVDVKFETGSLVYDSRNLICIDAITKEYDYILWLDSDMTFPADIIQRMLADMDAHDAQMVTGLYVKRTYPTLPVIYDVIKPPELNKNGQMVKRIHEYIDYPQNSLFTVAGCGFGCCMTSVPLLKKVWDTFGPAFILLPWAGEDHSFCYRVNQLNEQILCDSSISCGHIGSFLYTEQMLKRGGND